MRVERGVLAVGLLLSLAACVPQCDNGGGSADAGASGGGESSSTSAAPASSGASSSSGGASSGPRPDGGTTDAGADGGDGGSAVQLVEVIPNTGAVVGGYRVRLNGVGFTGSRDDAGVPTTHVFFGDTEATGLLLVAPGAVTVFVPPATGPGPVDVRVANPAGEATLVNGFTYFNAMTVQSVEPTQLPTAGGTLLTVRGSGFTADQVLLLGDRAAANLLVQDEHTVTAVAPPHAPGRVDVQISSEFGSHTLPLAVRYVAPLAPERLDPALGPVAGGNTVAVVGHGFTERTTVTLGGHAVSVVDFVGEDELRLVVPAASAPGLVDLDLADAETGASARLEAAYRYAESVTSAALTSVAPASGPVQGQTRVHLYGTQLFGNGLAVRFGGVAADSLSIVDASHLTALTPAAAAPGTVDVVVQRDGQELSLPAAFKYVAAVTLQGLEPRVGPDAGGTALSVHGSGLAAECTYLLGGQPLVDVQVSDATLARATTPPGSAGSVDLVVQCPGLGSATLPGAFTYRGALEVLSLDPPRGAMAGGTLVRISGRGFSGLARPQVFFDTMPVAELDVLGDSMLSVRTPPHGPGAVTVKVLVDQREVSRPRAYTYIDPTSVMGGTRGGPIQGSVNVTLLDSWYRLPIPDALVVLGTDVGSQYTGFTDERGQVVLSGPDIWGEQTITAAHCNFAYITLGGVNAADITLWMDPIGTRCGTPPPPSGGGGGQPLPPPPVIKGKVHGFSKDLFDPANLGANEVAAAFVTHTWAGVYVGMVPPNDWTMAPTQVVFVEGGDYVIPAAWRTGPMAVIAIAGIFNLDSGEFRALQMGFKRGLIADAGGVYEDQDVTLTIPLTKRLTIQIPDAPYIPPKTVANIVIPYVNLGGEGLHPIYGWDRVGENQERSYTLENFADAPAEFFTFIAQIQTLDDEGGRGTQPPRSTLLLDGSGPLGPAVSLQPMLGYPTMISPTDLGVMEQRTLRLKPPVGAQPSFYSFLLRAESDSTYWYAYLPGNRTKVTLPRFADYPDKEYAPPNLAPGAVSAFVESVFVPGFDFGAWSYIELWGQARQSWSELQFRFINAGN